MDHTYRDELYAYIGGVIRGEKGHLLEIGGIEDHVHILAGFSPTVSVSDMLKRIKANSSTWINCEKMTRNRLEWQTGYGAFTVSQSQVPVVEKYIQRQQEHHQKLSFEEEFRAILKRHGIEYDPKYLFETEHVG